MPFYKNFMNVHRGGKKKRAKSLWLKEIFFAFVTNLYYLLSWIHQAYKNVLWWAREVNLWTGFASASMDSSVEH